METTETTRTTFAWHEVPELAALHDELAARGSGQAVAAMQLASIAVMLFDAGLFVKEEVDPKVGEVLALQLNTMNIAAQKAFASLGYDEGDWIKASSLILRAMIERGGQRNAARAH